MKGVRESLLAAAGARTSVPEGTTTPPVTDVTDPVTDVPDSVTEGCWMVCVTAREAKERAGDVELRAGTEPAEVETEAGVVTGLEWVWEEVS